MMSTDIYFRADDSNRYLPWLIGIMATMATLLLCLGLTVSGWIIAAGSGYSRSFTVNVPAHSASAENLAKVEETLAAHPQIQKFARLSEAELAAMLEPWLGSAGDARNLPLPAVFDATLKNADAQIDYPELQKELSGFAQGTEIDAHERWIAAFASFSSMMQALLITLAAVLLLAMGIMIAFTSRASLKLHSRTVQLLHSIGAEDRYITRQFQYEAGRLALIGAAAGSALAGLVYFGVGRYIASLPAASLPTVDLGTHHLALVAALPLGCALLAWCVARWSVRRQLAKSM